MQNVNKQINTCKRIRHDERITNVRLTVTSDAIAVTSAVSQGPGNLCSHASELNAIGTRSHSERAFAMRSDCKLRLPLAELHVDIHRSVLQSQNISQHYSLAAI